MSTDENKQTVRRFLREIASGGNLDMIDDLVAPNYVNRAMGNVDLAGFKTLLSGMQGASDVQIDDLVAEGDAVVSRSSMNVTLATGKRVAVRAITYYRLAGGKIVEDDTMTTPDLTQLLGGALPATAGTTKVSRDSAPQRQEAGPVVDLRDELHGYTVSFTSMLEDIDATPFMKGLPDDRCQCPHWGYVFKGKMTGRFADRDEVYKAGDAFYTPPGHVPVSNEPGTEILWFSPSEELRTAEAVMMKNMSSMQGAPTR
jgi:ketosteroid isomerase-like protein